MARGILLVHSRPSGPDALEDYNRWYDEAHIPEMLGIAGIAGARRLEALDGSAFVVAYDVDDVDKAKAALADAQASGSMSRPVGVQLNPPPTVQWLRDYGGASD